MRNGLICSVIVMCSLAAVGQVPQWKVVKVIHLTGSATAQPMTILSPKTSSLYRLSAYMSIASPAHQGTGYYAALQWTDQTGIPETADLSVNLKGVT
jgi:hypothetical protein